MGNVHIVARTGHFSRLPKGYLTKAALLEYDEKGYAPIHYAAQYGHLSQIRPFLTQPTLTFRANNSRKQSPLHLAMEHISQVPKEFLTKENILLQDATGWTPLHAIAQAGRLSSIPSALLTEANLTFGDNGNDTPLHCAARFGFMEAITHLINAKSMNIKNDKGLTPLYTLAACGYAYKLPQHIFTAENLLNESPPELSGHHGSRPIDALVAYQELDLILGVELPESCRELVGDLWFRRNQELIKTRTNTAMVDPSVDIDVF